MIFVVKRTVERRKINVFKKIVSRDINLSITTKNFRSDNYRDKFRYKFGKLISKLGTFIGIAKKRKKTRRYLGSNTKLWFSYTLGYIEKV